MNAPVAALAVLAAIGGWLQVPGGWGAIHDWLQPVLADVADPLEATTTGEWVTGIVSSAVALVGIGVAWWLFAVDPARGRRLGARLAGPRSVLEEAYRFDEIYDETVVKPGRELGDVMVRGVEPGGVQGVVVAAVETARGAAVGLRAAQTGLVRTYVWAVTFGAVIVGVIVALVR